MAALLSSLDELLSRVHEAAGRAGPDVARAAVFDADGTLWRGDIGDAAFEVAVAAGMIDDATWAGPLRAWAERWELMLPTDPQRAVERIFVAARTQELGRIAERRGLPDAAWREDLYGMQAWAYAGRSRARVGELGARLFREGFVDGIFADMRALLQALHAAGIEVWIASASHGALVEAGAVHLGIPPERALGMEPALDAAGVTLPSIARGTFGPGKAATARQALAGRRPLAAFGDSVLSTDRELLELAALPVAVATSGLHREAALAHPRMVLFDPQR